MTARLTGDQKVFFDEQGYLVVENALPPETVSELNQAIDEVYEHVKEHQIAWIQKAS